MNKNILMISSAVYLPGEGGYKREMFLFDLMRKDGMNVHFLTSDFNHYSKEKRNINLFYEQYPDYKNIHFVHIPPYKKNISFRRAKAESVWAKEAVKWIKNNISKFDVIYGEMPDIKANIKIRKLCDLYNTEFIVDIRDLRPEAYKVIIKNDFLYKILTWNISRKANKAYAAADELVAVSKEYLNRGLKVNKRSKRPLVVYLGATLDKFFNGVSRFSSEIYKPENEIWLIYAGTLGSSYDLTTVLEAARIIQNENTNIRFKLLGQGPDRKMLEGFLAKNKIQNVDFLGFQPYEKMAAYLCKSDITINAVKKNASQSIINKVADYFAAGVPILSSCTCKEQIEMINENHVGLNYEPGNPVDLVRCINYLLEHEKERIEMGQNAKKLALNKFDREKTHQEIVELIKNI